MLTCCSHLTFMVETFLQYLWMATKVWKYILEINIYTDKAFFILSFHGSRNADKVVLTEALKWPGISFLNPSQLSSTPSCLAFNRYHLDNKFRCLIFSHVSSVDKNSSLCTLQKTKKHKHKKHTPCTQKHFSYTSWDCLCGVQEGCRDLKSYVGKRFGNMRSSSVCLQKTIPKFETASDLVQGEIKTKPKFVQRGQVMWE